MKTRVQRLLSGLLACCLVCTVLTWNAEAAGVCGFRDVPANHWAASSIQRCVELGLFQGESATTFGVGHEMNRAGFTVVLARLFGWETTGMDVNITEVYEDVPANAWYAGAAAAAYTHGALTRQSASFRPDEPITREELAVMLLRAMGYGSMTGLFTEAALPFRDVTTNRGYIAMAYEMGLVNGMSKTLFVPGRAATREQAAVVLSRLYGRLHPASEESMAILRTDEAMPDLSGCQTVILMAGSLTGGQKPQVSVNPGKTQDQARTEAQASGKTVLLGISGLASVLKNGTAAVQDLAQAVADGGYDGLYLNISQQAWTDAPLLTQLAQALRAAMPEKKLYVAADAPVSGQTAPDYTALGQAADKLVLRVAAYTDTAAEVPVYAMEPLEHICYALGVLTDQVPAGKLSLLLTAAGQAKKSGGKFTAADAKILETLTGQGTAYYSDRYACAYVETKDTVAWYLDGRALTARRQLLNCFGVSSLCVSTLNGTLSVS